MKYNTLIRLLILFVWIGCSYTTQAQIVNPFDLKRKNDTIINPQKYAAELKIDRIISEINADPLSPNTSNPFEVSHIPLRRITSKTNLPSQSKLNSTSISFDKITFFLLLITWALLLLVTAIRKTIISRIFRCISNQNFLKLVLREDNSGLNFQFILLYIIFLINFSLFLYYSNHYFWNFAFFESFWQCLLIALTLLLAKHITLYIFSNIFDLEKEILIFNFLVYLFAIVIGISLIPILPFYIYLDMPYTQILFYFIAFLLVLGVILVYIKAILSTINRISNSIFLFFIYLCGLEIIPIFLLIKFWYNIWDF